MHQFIINYIYMQIFNWVHSCAVYIYIYVDVKISMRTQIIMQDLLAALQHYCRSQIDCTHCIPGQIMIYQKRTCHLLVQ